MPLTPEQQVADVIQRMAFVKPTNINTSFQQPAPMIAAPEPEITDETTRNFIKTVERVMKNSGMQMPSDRT